MTAPSICGAHPSLAPHLIRPRLGAQEIEVIRVLAWFGNKAAVGRALYLSPGTINTVLARVRLKYKEVGRPAPNQILLIRVALQDGIVCPHELLGHYREHGRPHLPPGVGRGLGAPTPSDVCQAALPVCFAVS